MTKIKKIVAAALVAASVGTVGMTASAFAATSKEYRFNFAFTSSEVDMYDHNGGRKDSDWSDPALVNCQAGDLTNVSSSRPVKFSVWDSNDPDYTFQMTPTVTATKTNYEYSLPYTLIMGRIVFLYGEGDAGTTVSGKWTP